MIKRTLCAFLRFLSLSALVFMCFGFVAPVLTPEASAQSNAPRIWLGDSQRLAVNYVGPGASAGVDTSAAQPVSMVQGDFDQDGINDLAVGFSAAGGGFIAIHRGNLDAFAPQSEASFQAIGRGQFPSPFLPQAKTFPVPVSPDFIAAGDFTGRGNTDLAVASRGGSTIYIFAGDGKGNFTAGQTINLPGGVTSLAAGGLGRPEPISNLLAGVSSPQQTLLAVYGVGKQGLAPVTAFPLSAPATSINFAEFGDMGRQDAAFLSGGQVFILRSSTMQLSKVSLPVSALAMALGSFIFDRNAGSQIALLASDGSIQIAARGEFDPRVYTNQEFSAIRHAVRNGQTPPLVPAATFPMNGWKIVESFPGVGSVTSGQAPVFLRTRVSNHGADDIMWLNASGGQAAVVSHADVVPGASTFVPGAVSLMPYSGTPLAAISARVNVDARPGILALHQGQMAPMAMMPIPDPNFFVNRTDDPTPTSPIANACTCTTGPSCFTDLTSSCSLREAVLKANGDTIMLQAGTTYTLTIAKVANDCTGNFGALSAEHTVTIVGADQNTTIIQAGATNATGVDMVMNVNEDLGTTNCPQTDASATISNLTIQNGHNRGTHNNDGDGGCMEFDTGTSGNDTLSLTNVTLNNCSTTQGNGGGIAIFNFIKPTGTGGVTISNSIIQNNSASDSVTVGTGGGIWVAQPGRLTMSNSQVLNNQATQTTATNGGTGGGITTTSNVSGSPTVTIHASTISNNQASGEGGGIKAGTNLSIDQGSVISGNSAGSANLTNQKDGGGIWAEPVSPDSITLSKVTITGNSAPNGAGGGIVNGSNGGGPMTISFSRLAGNSAGTAGTANLSNSDTTVTATNNWWGTNTPGNTITTTGASGSTTFDPFIVLTHTASPNKIRINQSSTLTGDMSKDNHGVGTALAGNLDVIVGLPITFDNPFLGTIPEAQPETLGNPVPTATATYNAGGAGGGGHADATVDQQTTTASIAVLQPPSITKSFNPTTVAINAPSTITFTIDNSVNSVPINASFTDNLPTNLVVANTPNVVNNCGGTFAPASGDTTLSFSNNALAVGICTIKVDVKGTIDGVFHNSVQILSSDAGDGNTASSSPDLTVISPPTIAKAFNPAQVVLNAGSTLTFTIQNPNTNGTLTGIAFTDNLPAGVSVADGTSSACGATNNVTTSAASGTVVLTGGTLAGNASCSFNVTVTGTTAGVKTNTTGTITATESGAGATSNTAVLTVVAPPVISKEFGPFPPGTSQIPVGGTVQLNFLVTNPNSTATLTGIGFTDTLPAGLIVSTPNNLVGSCGGGTITANPGTNGISLAGATLTAGQFCGFGVSVTGIAVGQQNNTTSAVTSIEGGTGNTASASILVVAPPSIAKGFSPGGIQPNGVSTLTITLTNPPANTVAEAGVAFTDSFPANVVVATPNNLNNTCGGTPTATAGTGIVSLSGGSIAVNSSCTVSVSVTSSFTGTYLNTAGPVSSTNGGTGNSASATLAVANPPTISKLFLPNTTVQSGTSLLSFTITNPNSNSAPPSSDVTLTGIAFTDSLPAGLVVASAGVTSNDCDGTVTATPGSSSITLTGGDLAPAVGLITRRAKVSRAALGQPTAAGQCFISVKVQATASPGTLNNTTGAISANESGQGATSNTASLTVTTPPSPPTLAKAFAGATIPANTPTPLTFTMTNPNAGTAMTNIAFNDTLPAGMVVANPNGLPNGCADPSANVTGDVIAVPGSNSISMTALSLNGSASCSFFINVIGTSPGAKTNTTSAVTATFDDGTGTFIPITGLPATASTTVLVPDLAIAKSHSGSFTQGDVGDTYTITVSNAGSAPTTATVTVTDAAPAGLIPTNIAGTGWTCTLGTLTCTRSDSLANGGSYPPITLTVSVAINAPASVTNSASVSGGGETNTANDTANDPTTIIPLPGPPLTITLLVPATQTIKSGNTATFVFDVVSHSALLGNINFACSGLPFGAACSFSPASENQGDAQVTLTMTTTANTSSALPLGIERTGPVYAALLFPVVGLLSLAAAGRRGRKSRLRLILLLGGLLALMALLGCGGTPHNGTPIGAHPITVTATSAAIPTVSASTQVVVTVQ